MGYEHKENTGTIFKNKFAKEEKHPGYKGQINVEGKLFDIAMWVKEYEGNKYFSVSISEPYKKPEQESEQEPIRTSDPAEIEDPPF